MKAKQTDGVATITPQMYAMQKPDSRFVTRRIAELEGRVEELSNEDRLGNEEMDDENVAIVEN